MNLKNKFLLGAVATLGTGLFAAPAMSALTYDLRFADGTKVKEAVAGNYTVNLYAVIDQGDGSFANDSITGGVLSIYSSQTGAGALQPGTNSGITARGALSTSAATAGYHPDLRLATNNDGSGNLQRDENGVADPNSGTATYLTDGILDWGSDERYITAGGGATVAAPSLSNYFVEGASVASQTKSFNYRFAQPFVPGTPLAGGASQASSVRPNAWEVLIGTFTIAVNGPIGLGNTSFTPFSFHKNRASSTAPSASGGSNYSQDGSLPTANPGGVNEAYLANSFSGVTLTGVIPEPSTYVLCGLAAAAGFFGLRRRKTA